MRIAGAQAVPIESWRFADPSGVVFVTVAVIFREIHGVVSIFYIQQQPTLGV